jgi:hypothetical protein
MYADPLYLKLRNELKPGQEPISVADVRTRWGYAESHSRSVLGWMANEQQPPTMRRLPDVMPQRWERI